MTEWWPYAPPGLPPAPPRRQRKDVVVVGCAAAVVLVAGLLSIVGRTVSSEVTRERARKAQVKAAQAEFDRALDGPADTATVSPAPDGSRRYDSPSPDTDRHAFHLTLPRGWEGRHVGARESAYSYSDSIVTGPGGGIVIDRIDLGVPFTSAEFSHDLVEALKNGAEPMTLKTTFTGTTIGEGEPASQIEGTVEDGDDLVYVRVIVFEHGHEVFRVDLATPEGQWSAVRRPFDAILASWRWD